MTTRSPPPSQRILSALYSRIERVIEGLGQHHGTELRVKQAGKPSSTPSEILARIEGPSIAKLRICIAVHRVEKRIYEVRVTLDEGPVRAFTYCPPDGSRSTCGRVQLERKIVSLIRDEVYRRAGSD